MPDVEILEHAGNHFVRLRWSKKLDFLNVFSLNEGLIFRRRGMMETSKDVLEDFLNRFMVTVRNSAGELRGQKSKRREHLKHLVDTYYREVNSDEN
jgi:hypothetical protein